MRHTMATKLLALGMDITHAQRFLGHENTTTTRHYAETTAPQRCAGNSIGSPLQRHDLCSPVSSMGVATTRHFWPQICSQTIMVRTGDETCARLALCVDFV